MVFLRWKRSSAVGSAKPGTAHSGNHGSMQPCPIKTGCCTQVHLQTRAGEVSPCHRVLPQDRRGVALLA